MDMEKRTANIQRKEEKTMLPEISLNVLDITENSVSAKASLIEISIQIQTSENRMFLSIKDNGCGMSPEMLDSVTDPFVTTRTTRKIGLGIPFLKQSAECTGGSFSIQSKVNEGTMIAADYHTDHIDCMPLGDITSSIYTLVTMHPEVDFIYTYKVDEREFVLDTREIREIMGDVPFSEPEVAMFIREFLTENKKEVDGEN